MKTKRDILSLGPCRCLFTELNEKEQNYRKNTKYMLFKCEKKKKVIGRLKNDINGKKSF